MGESTSHQARPVSREQVASGARALPFCSPGAAGKSPHPPPLGALVPVRRVRGVGRTCGSNPASGKLVTEADSRPHPRNGIQRDTDGPEPTCLFHRDLCPPLSLCRWFPGSESRSQHGCLLGPGESKQPPTPTPGLWLWLWLWPGVVCALHRGHPSRPSRAAASTGAAGRPTCGHWAPGFSC